MALIACRKSSGFRTANSALTAATASKNPLGAMRFHVTGNDVIVRALAVDHRAAEARRPAVLGLRRHSAARIPHRILPRRGRLLIARFVKVGWRPLRQKDFPVTQD